MATTAPPSVFDNISISPSIAPTSPTILGSTTDQHNVDVSPKKPQTTLSSTAEAPGKEPFYFLVMGTAGAGTSSFTRCAMGRDRKEAPPATDITEHHAIIDNRTCCLFDTPPLGGPSDADTMRKIIDKLSSLYRQGVKVCGVFDMHPANEKLGSIAVDRINRLCGPLAMENVVFVSTKWDELDKDEFEQAEKDEEEGERMVVASNLNQIAHLARHNNTKQSARNIIKSLLDRVDPVVLAVQTQVALETLEDAYSRIETLEGRLATTTRQTNKVLEAHEKRIEVFQKQLDEVQTSEHAVGKGAARKLPAWRQLVLNVGSWAFLFFWWSILIAGAFTLGSAIHKFAQEALSISVLPARTLAGIREQPAMFQRPSYEQVVPEFGPEDLPGDKQAAVWESYEENAVGKHSNDAEKVAPVFPWYERVDGRLLFGLVGGFAATLVYRRLTE